MGYESVEDGPVISDGMVEVDCELEFSDAVVPRRAMAVWGLGGCRAAVRASAFVISSVARASVR